MKIFVSFFLMMLVFDGVATNIQGEMKKDSLATIEKDGKQYILHQVEAEETITKIAKKYKVTVNNIIAANPDLKDSNNLTLKQVLNIPIIINTTYYRIKPGDNLFRIARKTGMTIDRLKEINNLENQYISPGQMLLIESKNVVIVKDDKKEENQTVKEEIDENKDLVKDKVPQPKEKVKVPVYHVVANGEGLYRISKNYHITIDSLLSYNNLDKNKPLKKGQRLIVGYRKLLPPSYQINTKSNIGNENANNLTLKNPFEKNTNLNKKETINHHEKGNGEKVVADNLDNKTKKTAFHKTIPIGTFVRVTNPSNGVSTVVRVIARIPNTDRNKDIMIKLSQAACDALGLVNNKFPIEIAYNLSSN